jgi:hypothetical protein
MEPMVCKVHHQMEVMLQVSVLSDSYNVHTVSVIYENYSPVSFRF